MLPFCRKWRIRAECLPGAAAEATAYVAIRASAAPRSAGGPAASPQEEMDRAMRLLGHWNRGYSRPSKRATSRNTICTVIRFPTAAACRSFRYAARLPLI